MEKIVHEAVKSNPNDTTTKGMLCVSRGGWTHFKCHLRLSCLLSGMLRDFQ